MHTLKLLLPVAIGNVLLYFFLLLFLYNKVAGDVVTTTGIQYEPILLHFNYPSSDGMAEISSGFTKLQTLLDLKVSEINS